jgi:hypothetical protein
MTLALTRRITGVLLFAFAGLGLGAGAARAADNGPAAQIAAHNKNFLAAYEKGETAKMKTEIGKSLALGEKNGLAEKADDKALMADTYVLAAILEVDGNENRPAGVRDFVKALKLKADVAIPQGMATSPVKAALKEARAEVAGAPTPAPKEAVAAAPAAKGTKEGTKEATKEETKAAPGKDDDEGDKKAEPDKKAADAEKKTAADDKKAADAEKKAAAEDKKAADAEKRAAAEDDKKQREVADKQGRDKAERDKQLAAAAARAATLEKDKADRDKQIADAKARAAQLEKDKADAKTRAATLEKDKADRDKQLADAKARVAQLEAEKADRDKKIAELTTRVKQLEHLRDEREQVLAEARAAGAKEREAREKVERERFAAATRAQQAEDQRKHDQQERERLLAGPEMPARLPEALHCAVPDEAPAHADLYVHCAARANVKAKTIVFYYRVGGAHYTSVTLDRTSKGWYAAVIPGARVVGKSMQYYAQAFDARENVAAKNGKESSPNVLMLRSGGPRG